MQSINYEMLLTQKSIIFVLVVFLPFNLQLSVHNNNNHCLIKKAKFKRQNQHVITKLLH